MSQLELSCVQGGVNPLYKCFALGKAVKEACFYACSNSIIVNNINKVTNYFTLSGHSDRVNFVKTINNFSERQLIVSGSSDSNLIIWEGKLSNLFIKENWSIKHKFNLNHSVSFATVLEYSPNLAYVVAGNIMGDVYIIKISDESNQSLIMDSITFGHHFTQECTALIRHNPNKDEFLIALGGLDFTVHIYHTDLKKYTAPVDGKNTMERGTLFEYKVSLKGHENAITDLQVLKQKKDTHEEWIIASSSKDTYVRLWRFSELLEDETIKQISEFQNKQTQRFVLGDKKYFITLESVLSGHGEAVVCLDWGLYKGETALISASFDFNIILWTKDKDTDIWLTSYRLGQVTGSKYAFFQATFNADYTQIFSYTYTGSFYLWEYNQEKGIWDSKPTVSGHFNQVFDLDWSTKGDFLVSCGLDQTTRIITQSSQTQSWHEISRAQIHGYDINSIKCYPVQLENKNICDTLICGADEKVVRLFEPPAAFVNAVNQMSNTDLHLYFQDDNQEKKYLDQKQLEKGIFEYQVSQEGGAQVLGLMIKAIKLEPDFDPSKYVDPEDEGGLISDKIQSIEDKKKEEELFSQKHDFTQPPIEDYLIKHTLWPELNKLYGHGYELKCVSCSNDGKLIASCSKSQTKENACVIFWNPTNYQIYSKLEYHNFTINQMEFSPSDEYFATVSKDRSLALFKKNYLDEAKKELNFKEPYALYYNDKSHTRIIYSAAFSHDEKFIATGARDKRIKIHSILDKKVIFNKVLSSTITALAFAPISYKNENSYLIIVGYEEGGMELYEFESNTNQLNLIDKPHEFIGHTNTISRIKFRKNYKPNINSKILQFATCSLDHTVRVFNFKIN
ncbi:elongator complex protein (macronuclear) [Tetrahymena thermophila SB210]|uniref:Elongator complex protein 2 n=1 Tax=Tetrahymena thermophila (strain SB210) TaxID=312017 RepID=Q22KQ7_TETTS|nr:elongator complex protein [Tetrahymena thermophila SB210]EAR85742.1 elongator complex protein [Tetrahymena thermophila SB210]|eukprot:XP_001033405.1 elongator complex protein [Tetrahymena thermophila SB210]